MIKYDCLGENKLPWFYEIEAGLDRNFKEYYFVQDESPERNERVATLRKGKISSWVVDADPGFKTSDKGIQQLVDEYYCRDLLYL